MVILMVSPVISFLKAAWKIEVIHFLIHAAKITIRHELHELNRINTNWKILAADLRRIRDIQLKFV
jgi:hypothetical protein